MSITGGARTWWPAVTVGAAGAISLGAAMVLPWSYWTAWGGRPSGIGTDTTYLLAGDDCDPETAAVLALTWVVTIGALALRWRGGRIAAVATAVVGVVVCPGLAGHAIGSEQRLWDGKNLVTGQYIGGADVMRPDAGSVLASLAQLARLVTAVLVPARRPGRDWPGRQALTQRPAASGCGKHGLTLSARTARDGRTPPRSARGRTPLVVRVRAGVCS